MPRRLRYAVTLTTLAWAVATAGADTIVVTSDSGGTGGPDCTLRDAITAANTNTATGGCPAGSGADTIELPASATITLTAVDNYNEGDNGLPPIVSAITINGNGATIERSSFVATPEFRIFYVSAELILSNVSVVNGEANAMVPRDGMGGGLFIAVGATVLLTDITVSGNTAYLGGGGIASHSADSVTLTNCIVNGNSAGGIGGGILNDGTGLSLTNTTVCGNTPDQIFGDPWTDNGGNLISNDCTSCGGEDLDSDGAVGPIDLAILLAFWGPCPESCEPGDPATTCAADLTGDCDVEAFDLAVLLGSWGPCE